MAPFLLSLPSFFSHTHPYSLARVIGTCPSFLSYSVRDSELGLDYGGESHWDYLEERRRRERSGSGKK